MEAKFQQLFELGEASRSRKWPDYLQYGFSEQDIPKLIELMLDDELNDAKSTSNEVWVPLHCWRAIGQIGSPKAIEPLITLFDYLEDDDWAFEELPVVMGMIGDTALDPLSEHLNEKIHNEYSRVMAADGILRIAISNPSAKKQSIGALVGYLEKADKQALALNSIVTGNLIDLKATEAIGTIRRIYEAGMADPAHCGDIEDIEISLGLREKRSTPAKNYLFPYMDEPHPFIKRATPKIGRNDPCPCGSGKKYKKCCLN